MRVSTSRLWGARFALPAIHGDMGERRYAKNCTVTCICQTLEEALAMIRAKFPDAVIWGVNHRGQDDYYFQKSHTVLMADGAVPLAGGDEKVGGT